MDSDIYQPAYVKRLFNGMSNSYERMNMITSFGFSIRWRRQFLNKIEIKNSESTIDLLSGLGEMWSVLKSECPDARLTALDFSEEMVKRASNKNNKQFGNSIDLRLEDILENSLPSDHFDLVVCVVGLKTFSEEQLERLSFEVHRILKRGGQFSFIEVSVPSNRILRALYGFYLGKIIPVLGRLFLGNPEEYRMLWRYTRLFGNAKDATEIFRISGLDTVYSTYFFGCASGFYGRKEGSDF
ncbi:MAG: class I SAM-dependent methyltransferase [Flavobacteriales bacterium]